jgi:hypothetical protein
VASGETALRLSIFYLLHDPLAKPDKDASKRIAAKKR